MPDTSLPELNLQVRRDSIVISIATSTLTTISLIFFLCFVLFCGYIIAG